MLSVKFRYQLKKEVEKWRSEGLINQDLSEELATRYQFRNLDQVSQNRFLAVITTLGFIILGLSVITFVAANWQAWSKSVKVFILLSFFLGVNITGFYLWQEQTENWKSRLGQGLLLLGALSFGADIGLMSQIFHQTDAIHKLFLVWGFGVLAMAYGLQLTSLGILAIILTTISYFTGLYQGIFYEFGNEFLQMPLLIGLLFIPLAYWCKSRWIFCLSLILLVITFDINSLGLIESKNINNAHTLSLLMIILAVLPAACLWAYRNYWQSDNHDLSKSFESISRKLAIFYLSLSFYTVSFHQLWEKVNNPNNGVAESQNLYYCWLPILGIMISIWLWWQLGRSHRNNSLWRLDSQSTAIGIMILVSGFLILWHQNITVLNGFATVMFNLLLFVLAIGLIRRALANGKRLGYWWAIFLLSLQLLSRMFEYNTGLLLKALVLFICGITIIASGFWFEKYLQRANNS